MYPVAVKAVLRRAVNLAHQDLANNPVASNLVAVLVSSLAVVDLVDLAVLAVLLVFHLPPQVADLPVLRVASLLLAAVLAASSGSGQDCCDGGCTHECESGATINVVDNCTGGFVQGGDNPILPCGCEDDCSGVDPCIGQPDGFVDIGCCYQPEGAPLAIYCIEAP